MVVTLIIIKILYINDIYNNYIIITIIIINNKIEENNERKRSSGSVENLISLFILFTTVCKHYLTNVTAENKSWQIMKRYTKMKKISDDKMKLMAI